VAIVEPTSIAAASDTKLADAEANILQGMVSRLALEKTNAEIVVTILIGNLPFTSKLPRQQVQQESLYPGRKVTLYYSPSSVKWL